MGIPWSPWNKPVGELVTFGHYSYKQAVQLHIDGKCTTSKWVQFYACSAPKSLSLRLCYHTWKRSVTYNWLVMSVLICSTSCEDIIASLSVMNYIIHYWRVLARVHTSDTPHWNRHSVVSGEQQVRACKSSRLILTFMPVQRLRSL